MYKKMSAYKYRNFQLQSYILYVRTWEIVWVLRLVLCYTALNLFYEVKSY